MYAAHDDTTVRPVICDWEELHAQLCEHVVCVLDILLAADYSQVAVGHVEVQLFPVLWHVETVLHVFMLHHARNEVHHASLQQAAGDG